MFSKCSYTTLRETLVKLHFEVTFTELNVSPTKIHKKVRMAVFEVLTILLRNFAMFKKLGYIFHMDIFKTGSRYNGDLVQN